MSKTGTIAVFAKPPTAGLSKTRLAPAVGSHGAARIAAALLSDTWSALASLPARRVISTSRATPELTSLAAGAPVWLQPQGDLGQRMQQALERGCQDGPWAIVVGADCPALTASCLSDAIAALEHTDAVLIPAKDGGFALIGLRRTEPGLLHDLPWSSPDTLRATVARLTERGLSLRLLPATFDVDTPGDLAHLSRWLADTPSAVPATRAALQALGWLPPVRLSAIVPCLNESARLADTLAALTAQPGIDEVIVVDGGSDDASLAIAQRTPNVRVISSATGRATQLNAGAAIARGQVLLFVHADCRLPDNAALDIHALLAQPEMVAGAFTLWTVPDSGPRASAWWMHIADVRSRYTKHPYGDQALFVQRHVFEAVGGFPDIALMEDYALSRALWSVGKIGTIRRCVAASGRRFEANALYYALLMNTFPLLYRAGVPPSALAALYRSER